MTMASDGRLPRVLMQDQIFIERFTSLWGIIATIMGKAIVIIYTRPGCHLCEEAKANIYAAGCSDEFVIEEINIDEDPALSKRYGYDIPVILINGVKAFKHRVAPADFKRKLRRLAHRL